MSWQATAWAKATRGHRSYAAKLLLMVLADYHNAETQSAWPSQRTLAEDCGMSVRTVQRRLAELQRGGFVVVLQSGNQYRPMIYGLNFGLTQVEAQSTNHPQRSDVAGATASARQIEQVQPPTVLVQ